MIDVVVIGAGPAGTQTALALARKGRTVVLLDARHEIGDKPCTGIISTECAEEYDLPPALIRHAARSAFVFPPEGEPIHLLRSETQAYVIDRVGFVRTIAERAVSHGASMILGARVVGLKIGARGVRVTVRLDNREEQIDARATVVATGFQAGVARGAGIRAPRAIGLAAQVELTGIDVREVHVFARRIVPSSAFGWLVPCGEGRALAGLLGREQPQHSMTSFLAGLSSMGFDFNVECEPRYWGVPLRAARRTHGNRCLTVGDVAGQIKPTTGGGILYALRGGDMAAEVLDEALEEDDLSARRLSQYDEMWKADLGREIRLGYLARLFYERMSDRDLDRILRAADESGLLQEEVSFDHHSEMVTRALKSRLFLSVLGAVPGVAARMAVSRP